MFAYENLTYEELLDRPEPSSHFVQFYEADRQALAANAARYFSEGLLRGDSVMAVATPETKLALLRALKHVLPDHDAALRSPRITFLDAVDTLRKFLVGGYPDSVRFDVTVGETIRAARKRSPSGGLRVYGEMVGTLWQAKEYPAAIRLEQLWNHLKKSVGFSLFCAYQIDIFDADFGVGVLDAMLCAHSHLLPTASGAAVERAVDRALAEICGDDGARRPPTPLHMERRAGWPKLPQGEAVILWLRQHHAERADEILSLAREYYRTSA